MVARAIGRAMINTSISLLSTAPAEVALGHSVVSAVVVGLSDVVSGEVVTMVVIAGCVVGCRVPT